MNDPVGLNNDPLHHTRTGRCDSVAATEAHRMVTDEGIRDQLKQHLQRESLEMLRRVASGEPIRNARDIVAAIKTQLSFAISPPKQLIEAEITNRVIQVVDPYASEPDPPSLPALDLALDAALPPPIAKPPRVRRKGAKE